MQQRWNSDAYARNGRFVAQLADPLVESLNPQPGEKILDLGCGDGFLTRRIAESGAQVVGVDSSPEMVAAARARGVDARRMNGERLSFEQEFDAVFSNAALHWMRNQDAVLKNVWQALKPGGRFVAEFGGHGNIAAIRVALLAVLIPRGITPSRIESNYFFTVSDYRSRLERGGFQVVQISLTPRQTPLPSGIDGWLNTFRHDLLEELPGGDRAAAMDEITNLLKPVLCDEEGKWTADYVRLRFVARRS